jgi:hypothetical protein
MSSTSGSSTVTRDEGGGPRPLGDSLRKLASRVARVDLVGFASVESAWPSVTAAAASGAVPVRLAHAELTVEVRSGAHAARARRDAPAMLAELAALLTEPPTALRVVVRPA